MRRSVKWTTVMLLAGLGALMAMPAASAADMKTVGDFDDRRSAATRRDQGRRDQGPRRQGFHRRQEHQDRLPERQRQHADAAADRQEIRRRRRRRDRADHHADLAGDGGGDQDHPDRVRHGHRSDQGQAHRALQSSRRQRHRRIRRGANRGATQALQGDRAEAEEARLRLQSRPRLLEGDARLGAGARARSWASRWWRRRRRPPTR